MRTLLILLTVLSLTSCFTTKEMVKSTYAPNQPETYQDGFTDGCESGQAAEGSVYSRFTKDIQRYSSDTLYQMGWNDGFPFCAAKIREIRRW